MEYVSVRNLIPVMKSPSSKYMLSILSHHLKLNVLWPLPATGSFRHRFVSSSFHFAHVFRVFSYEEITASFLISSGSSVANAKGCIFSSVELSIALLAFILLY